MSLLKKESTMQCMNIKNNSISNMLLFTNLNAKNYLLIFEPASKHHHARINEKIKRMNKLKSRLKQAVSPQLPKLYI